MIIWLHLIGWNTPLQLLWWLKGCIPQVLALGVTWELAVADMIKGPIIRTCEKYNSRRYTNILSYSSKGRRLVGWSLSQPFGSETVNIFGYFLKMVKIRPSWAVAVCLQELYFLFTSSYNWSYNHIHQNWVCWLIVCSLSRRTLSMTLAGPWRT